MKNYFLTFAKYNQWANKILYDSCKKLSTTDYYLNRKAFFSSIHGTLNHILLVDRLWFDRAKGVATGAIKLDEILYSDLPTLIAAREDKDLSIISQVNNIDNTTCNDIIH